MTAPAVPATEGRRRALPRLGGRFGALGSFFGSVTAVGAKELRGRMRGRRAFVVLTIYLLLLSAFAFGIYEYLRQQALQTPFSPINSGGGIGFPGQFPGGVVDTSSQGTALSATVGHAIFSGLIVVETLLILVLAPAFTSGAVSLEREKQTLDLLVVTPLSTFGMVLGKLLSALTWVFLLILASVPLASIVFAFGGVGPEDLVRGYALLFALAFGMGALGLFISAIVRRTQTATVLTFVAVLALTLGSMAVHEFWRVVTTPAATSSNGFISVVTPSRPPEALLWLNPFVGDMDLICTTAPGGYEDHTCGYVAQVTGTPYFGAPVNTDPCGMKGPCAVPFRGGDVTGACPPNALCAAPAPAVVIAVPANGGGGSGGGGVTNDDVVVDPGVPTTPTTTLGFPRDTFWPHNVIGFVVTGVLLTLISSQLVAPTRRLHLIPRRLARSRRRAAMAAATPVNTSTQPEETDWPVVASSESTTVSQAVANPDSSTEDPS